MGLQMSSTCLPCRVVLCLGPAAMPPRAVMENGGAVVASADDHAQDGASADGSAWQIIQAPVTHAVDVPSLQAVMREGQGHANYQTVQAMANESKHEITMNLYKKRRRKTMITTV